jgi:hypothetical protein
MRAKIESKSSRKQSSSLKKSKHFQEKNKKRICFFLYNLAFLSIQKDFQ